MEHGSVLLEFLQTGRMFGIELHLQVSQEVGLLREELAANGAVVHTQLFLRLGRCSTAAPGVGHHVVPVDGLLAVGPVADGAGEEGRWISMADVDEVRQRSTTREDAPVVRMILVDVLEETHLIQTLLLTHLTGKVVWTCQTGMDLKRLRHVYRGL